MDRDDDRRRAGIAGGSPIGLSIETPAAASSSVSAANTPGLSASLAPMKNEPRVSHALRRP